MYVCVCVVRDHSVHLLTMIWRSAVMMRMMMVVMTVMRVTRVVSSNMNAFNFQFNFQLTARCVRPVTAVCARRVMLM